MERVEVQVQPYGTNYVEIISGLSGGEVLKAQSDASKSGRMSAFKKGSKGSRNNQGGMGGPMGMPPM